MSAGQRSLLYLMLAGALLFGACGGQSTLPPLNTPTPIPRLSFDDTAGGGTAEPGIPALNQNGDAAADPRLTPPATQASSQADGETGSALETEVDASGREDQTVTANADDERLEAGDTEIGVWGAAGQYVELSKLLGRGVREQSGLRMGRINEIVVSPHDGRILYVTIEYGGLLNLGDRHAPVPLSALRWNREQAHLTLLLRRQTLAEMSGNGDGGPNVGNPGWYQELVGRWRQAAPDLKVSDASSGEDAALQHVLRAKMLSEKTVVDVHGEELATVTELLVNLGAGAVDYLILEPEVEGIAGQSYAVPFVAFDIALQTEQTETADLVLSASASDFAQAPVYDPEQTDVNQSSWNDGGARQYWLDATAYLQADPATTKD